MVEAIIIVVSVVIVASVIGVYVYKKTKGLPTGECSCCANKGKKFVKAYRKKYTK